MSRSTSGRVPEYDLALEAANEKWPCRVLRMNYKRPGAYVVFLRSSTPRAPDVHGHVLYDLNDQPIAYDGPLDPLSSKRSPSPSLCSSAGCPDKARWSGLCPSHYWVGQAEAAEKTLAELYEILKNNVDPEILLMHVEGDAASCIPCAQCNSFRVVGHACAFCHYSPGPPARTTVD